MATVRPITPPKPERLLTRRATRASTASSTRSQRKVTISKTTPLPPSQIKRANSSRMSLKKNSIPSIKSSLRVNSCTNITNKSGYDELTNKIATTTLTELPPIRRTSKFTDNNTLISSTPTVEINSDTIIKSNPIEVPQQQETMKNNNDNVINNENNNAAISSSSSSSSSSAESLVPEREPTPPPVPQRKSLPMNNQFTIESFDIVRTVGTGKIYRLSKDYI